MRQIGFLFNIRVFEDCACAYIFKKIQFDHPSDFACVGLPIYPNADLLKPPGG